MTDTDRKIRTARIDVPLRSTCAYLFVDAEQAKWNPWWESLFVFLLSFASDSLEWRLEPVQGVHVAIPVLTEQQRANLIRFLRTAPASQIAEHVTLRRAVELTPALEERLELMFFAGPLPHTNAPTTEGDLDPQNVEVGLTVAEGTPEPNSRT